MNSEQLQNLLRSYGLKPNFTYGQNFLVDDFVLQDIVDAAEVTSADTILEIGPGIGNLTKLLCERAGFVLSVEKDPKFLPILNSIKKEFKNFRFEISDALQFNFQEEMRSAPIYRQPVVPINGQTTKPSDVVQATGLPYKVVANIPYYITGKILQMLMTAKNKPQTITILTQKEVAQTVCAKAGDLSMLAISVQLFGTPEIIQIVQAKSFYPAPKVDSAVLQIKLFEQPKYNIGDEKKFFKVLRACFSGKRKQIHNTLKNNLALKKETVDAVLQAAKINPAVRPQELSIEQWILLTQSISKFQ